MTIHRKRIGVTLIEVVVSLILVSTILLVSITASANLVRNANQAQSALRAHELAGILLDEISTRAFVDSDDNAVFGVESDEDITDRSTLDDVDDYHGYTQTSPTYPNGQPIAAFTLWNIAISVTPATADSSGIIASSDPNDPLKLVTVTCVSPLQMATGEPLIRRESILVSASSQNVGADQSHEKRRQLELTFSPDRTITVFAPLRNLPLPVSN